MAGVRWRWLPAAVSISASLFLLGIGMVLLVEPDLGRRLFGLKPGLEDAYGFERATGIRQVYLGLLVLTAWWTRPRVAGLILMSLAVIPLSDFLIWLDAGSGLAKASEHLIGLLLLPIGASVVVADRRRASASDRIRVVARP